MCNFIIREEVKSYATVDIVQTDKDGKDIVTVERGDYVEVEYVKDNAVYGKKRGVSDVVIPLETFVHVFSDKEPKNDKQEKKTGKS